MLFVGRAFVLLFICYVGHCIYSETSVYVSLVATVLNDDVWEGMWICKGGSN